MSNCLKSNKFTLKSMIRILALLVITNLATADLVASKSPLNLIAEPVANVVGGTVEVAGFLVGSAVTGVGYVGMCVGYCCVRLGMTIDDISDSVGRELQDHPKCTATLVTAAALGYLYSQRA